MKICGVNVTQKNIEAAETIAIGAMITSLAIALIIGLVLAGKVRAFKILNPNTQFKLTSEMKQWGAFALSLVSLSLFGGICVKYYTDSCKTSLQATNNNDYSEEDEEDEEDFFLEKKSR